MADSESELSAPSRKLLYSDKNMELFPFLNFRRFFPCRSINDISWLVLFTKYCVRRSQLA